MVGQLFPRFLVNFTSLRADDLLFTYKQHFFTSLRSNLSLNLRPDQS